MTESNLRRYRTGFVELVSPVTHVWYLKSRPSKIALILNIPLKELEKVLKKYRKINRSNINEIRKLQK